VSDTLNSQQYPLKIGIVAGEKSGDLLGAGLMREIKKQVANVEFCGVGGDAMIAEGFKTLADMQLLSVMGLIEPLKRLPALISLRKSLFRYFAEQSPHLFIGIDAPDFNLGLEKKLKQRGVTTCHYVCPSVWAWRQGRVKKISRSVDHVLCLLPFEKQFLKNHQIDATFVGHPLADALVSYSGEQGVDQNKICLMPGSRSSEINALLDTFLQAALLCLARCPQLTFTLPAATQAIHAVIAERLLAPAYAALAGRLELVLGDAQRCMRESKAVLIASGTATLEAALLQKPMVVAYKMSELGYALASRMVHVEHVALPNLLCAERVVPELLQRKASAENLADELMRYIEEPETCSAVQARFSQLHKQLARGANTQAASAVLALCEQTCKNSAARGG